MPLWKRYGCRWHLNLFHTSPVSAHGRRLLCRILNRHATHNVSETDAMPTHKWNAQQIPCAFSIADTQARQLYYITNNDAPPLQIFHPKTENQNVTKFYQMWIHQQCSFGALSKHLSDHKRATQRVNRTKGNSAAFKWIFVFRINFFNNISTVIFNWYSCVWERERECVWD